MAAGLFWFGRRALWSRGWGKAWGQVLQSRIWPNISLVGYALCPTSIQVCTCAFYVFEKHCVIDQYEDDIQGGRVKYSKVADKTIKFDRFQVGLDDKVIVSVHLPL